MPLLTLLRKAASPAWYVMLAGLVWIATAAVCFNDVARIGLLILVAIANVVSKTVLSFMCGSVMERIVGMNYGQNS